MEGECEVVKFCECLREFLLEIGDLVVFSKQLLREQEVLVCVCVCVGGGGGGGQ